MERFYYISRLACVFIERRHAAGLAAVTIIYYTIQLCRVRCMHRAQMLGPPAVRYGQRPCNIISMVYISMGTALIFCSRVIARNTYGRPIWQAIIFCSCCFFFFFFFFFFLCFFFPSPILCGRRLDCLPYFHTWCGPSANLEWNAGLKRAARGLLKIQDARIRQDFAICAPSYHFVKLYLCN